MKHMNMISRYKELNKEVKAGVWFTICNFLNKGISLIVVPIYTRLLTTEDYGSYSVFISWFNVLLIVTTLEISRGYFKVGLVNCEENEDSYTFSLIGLSNAVTLVWLFIYCLNPSFFKAYLGINDNLMKLMIIYLLIYPIWEFWTIRQRFSYKYKNLVFATMLVAISTPIIGVAGILFTDYDLESAVFGKLAVQVLICIFFYVMYAIKGRKLYEKNTWIAALKFNLPLMPYLLSTVVLNQADRIQIQNICGASDTAIYSLAYSIAMILQLLNTAIQDSFIPWLFKALKNNKYDKIDEITNLLSILVAIVNLVLILFAPEIIAIFAPAEYAEAVWVIPPVTASVFFMFFFQRYINVEEYYGENFKVSLYSVIIAIINIALNQIFISVFGYIAAAYTTLFCYVLFTVIHYFGVSSVCKKHCGGFQIFHVKNSFIIGTAFLILVFIITITYRLTVVRYGIALLLVILSYRYRDYIIKCLNLLRKR